MIRDNFTQESKQRLGHSLADILFSCKFDYGVDCSADNFTWYFDSDYGNCFIFKGLGSSRTQMSPGMDYGLRLSFYVGFHANLTLFNAFNGMSGGGSRALVS